MISIDSACARAFGNLTAQIDVARRFPRKIFVGDWTDFLFFDADWMFDASFLSQVKRMLAQEGAVCACMLNLDLVSEAAQRERMFFMDQNTIPEAYAAVLRGRGPAEGWIYDIQRFGCTSDIGSWTFYCERENEIAVIGFRLGVAVQSFLPIMAGFKAVPAVEALDRPLTPAFSGLSASWADQLREEYATFRHA